MTTQHRPSPNQDLGQPQQNQTGELNTQAGSRQGQDRLANGNLGRHGQQMQGELAGNPSADQADPARVGNQQPAWQQEEPGQQDAPRSVGRSGPPQAR